MSNYNAVLIQTLQPVTPILTAQGHRTGCKSDKLLLVIGNGPYVDIDVNVNTNTLCRRTQQN